MIALAIGNKTLNSSSLLFVSEDSVHARSSIPLSVSNKATVNVPYVL